MVSSAASISVLKLEGTFSHDSQRPTSSWSGLKLPAPDESLLSLASSSFSRPPIFVPEKFLSRPFSRDLSTHSLAELYRRFPIEAENVRILESKIASHRYLSSATQLFSDEARRLIIETAAAVPSLPPSGFDRLKDFALYRERCSAELYPALRRGGSANDWKWFDERDAQKFLQPEKLERLRAMIREDIKARRDQWFKERGARLVAGPDKDLRDVIAKRGHADSKKCYDAIRFRSESVDLLSLMTIWTEYPLHFNIKPSRFTSIPSASEYAPRLPKNTQWISSSELLERANPENYVLEDNISYPRIVRYRNRFDPEVRHPYGEHHRSIAVVTAAGNHSAVELLITTARLAAVGDLEHDFLAKQRIQFPSYELKRWLEDLVWKAVILEYENLLFQKRE